MILPMLTRQGHQVIINNPNLHFFVSLCILFISQKCSQSTSSPSCDSIFCFLLLFGAYDLLLSLFLLLWFLTRNFTFVLFKVQIFKLLSDPHRIFVWLVWYLLFFLTTMRLAKGLFLKLSSELLISLHRLWYCKWILHNKMRVSHLPS